LTEEENVSTNQPNPVTISSDVRAIDPVLIDPNRYQPKSRVTFTPEQLADLESIQDKGLIYKPRVRVSPQDPQRFETVDGWRRRCAWMLFCPGELLPVEVVALDDQSAFTEMIIENAQRLQLNAIEKAETLLRYIAEFHATQAEAGKLFGIDQAAVSNLIRLKQQLPEFAQKHVTNGDLSEGIARRLIPAARVAEPQDFKRMVERVLKSDPSEREGTVFELIDDVLDDKGYALNTVPWPLSGWPKAPVLSVTIADASKGEPTDMAIGACKGCEWFVESNYSKTCVRGVCWRLKARLFARGEADKASKALGIAVQANDEKVTRIVCKSQDDLDWVKRVLKSERAKPYLRLMPLFQKLDDSVKRLEINHVLHEPEGLIGSHVVVLGTVDLPAVEKIVKRANGGDDGAPSESAAAQERKSRDKAAREQRAQTREQNEAERLIAAATKALAGALPRGLVLQMLAEQADPGTPFGYLGIAFHHHYHDDASVKKLSDAERQLVVMGWLLNVRVLGSVYAYGRHEGKSAAKVQTEIEEIARGLKTKLPKDWNCVETTPRLRKNDRCWYCGAEHGMGGRNVSADDILSQVDLERGWIIEPGVNNNSIGDIVCPECAQDTRVKSAKKAKK
jgi:ParB/RepB/Spo0J family partition protein